MQVRKSCNNALKSVIDALLGSGTTSSGSLDHMSGITKTLGAWTTLESSMARRLSQGSATSKRELTEELMDLSIFIADLIALCKSLLQSPESKWSAEK